MPPPAPPIPTPMPTARPLYRPRQTTKGRPPSKLSLSIRLAPRPGLEPGTYGLTVRRRGGGGGSKSMTRNGFRLPSRRPDRTEPMPNQAALGSQAGRKADEDQRLATTWVDRSRTDGRRHHLHRLYRLRLLRIEKNRTMQSLQQEPGLRSCTLVASESASSRESRIVHNVTACRP